MKRTWPMVATIFGVLLIVGVAPAGEEKERKQRTFPGFPDVIIPDFEDIFKDLKGLDPAQKEEIRKRLEKAQQEMKSAMEKAREEMRRAFEQGRGIVGKFPGRPERPRLGAMLFPAPELLTEQLNLPAGKGMIVERVIPDSPAAKLGLQKNDILLEIDGRAVPGDLREFVDLLGKIKPGTPVDVQVLRKGKKETLKGLTLPEPRTSGRRAPGVERSERLDSLFGTPSRPRREV